MVINLTQT